MRWAGAFGVVIALALASAGARAQEAPTEDAQARAQEFFAQGEAAYAEGRFTDAAGLMREAYRLSPAAILLYNLGRALEAAHDWEAAAEAYTQYLASEEELTHRGRAEAHLRAAQQAAERERGLREAAERATEAAAVPVAPPPPPPSAPVDPLPWIVAGAGALVAGVGGVFGGLVLDREGAARDAPSHREAYPAAQEGESFAIAANVLFVVGGLTAAAGVVWGVVALTSGGGASAEVALGPGTVAVRGRF